MKKLFLSILGRLPLPKTWQSIKSPFQSLTPTEDADDIKTYSEAMEFALSSKNKSIRNIAITGLYGAGKSSFLRTYFKGKKNVLWVSLAMFLEQLTIGKTESEIAEFEHKLELSILQQILHVRKEPTWWSWKVVITAVLIGCGVIGIMQPDVFAQYVSPSIRGWVACHAFIIFWFSLVEVSIVSLLAFRKVIYWLKNTGVKRVDVNGAGVASLGLELPDMSSCSILNRNIKAIISFFSTANYSIVVFEDIDRFNDLRIFTKLRELNLLLNNSQLISDKKKPIRFIYALREELFEDEKNKVKFFEFLIPIIPIINASNSRTKLLAFLAEWGDSKPDESLIRFVKAISSYISDLRLLKNICNEYYTYREQITDCTSENELLGLIVFKNFFPKEFALMHAKSGMMWEFLKIKNEAQERLASAIADKINALKNEIDGINAEKFQDIKQLQLPYYVTLMREFDNNNDRVSFKNQWRHSAEIIHHDDWFDILRKDGFKRNNYYDSPIKWTDIEKKTDPECSYEEHVKRIESRQNGRIEKIKHEILSLKERSLAIKRKTIQDLMADGVLTEDEIRSIVQKNSKDRQDAELVITLLKNGYLNEKFYYNISIFQEVDGVNSIQDYLFEVGVTRGDDMDWGTKLKNPKALVESLESYYFSSPSIMNFDICHELSANPESEKAKEFWRLISGKNRRCYEFVDEYLKENATREDAEKLFDNIMSANPNYISELIETTLSEELWPREFAEKQLGLYITWAMRQEKPVSSSSIVKDFMESTEAIPQLLKENGIVDTGAMTSFVKRFNMKLKALDFSLAQATSFIDVVISESAYAIDATMINGLLLAKGVDIDDLEKKHYSTIGSRGTRSIVEYVDREFKSYLDKVYSKLEKQQEDPIETVAKVMNRDDLCEEDIVRFVEKQSAQGKIDSAEKLESDRALSLCIKLRRLVPSWQNAVKVWCRTETDRTLFWEYVNDQECYSLLSQKNLRGIAWEKDEWWAKRFAEEKQLSDEAMNALLSGMSKGVISDYSGANATPKRIEYLAKGNRIRYSNELYQALRKKGNDSHIAFASMFVNEFCNEYSNGMVNEDDAKKLLAPDRISRRNVPKVVNMLKRVVLSSEGLISDVANFVNAGNFTLFDEKVLDATIPYIHMDSVQCKIIQLLGGSSDEIRERLTKMGEPYRKLGELGCHPQICKWDGLESFLDFLKDKNIVSSISEGNDGKIQVHTTKS